MNDWHAFHADLMKVERTLKDYRGVFEVAESLGYAFVPNGALASTAVDDVLSSRALSPPHGLALLRQSPLPPLPKMPDGAPDKYFRSTVSRHKMIALRAKIVESIRDEQKQCEELDSACRAGEPVAICRLLSISLIRHPLANLLTMDANFAFDTESKVVLCTIQVPDFARLAVVRRRGTAGYPHKWAPVSETEKKRTSERLLYSLCVRAGYLTAMSDPGDFFDIVAVNAHQKWFDPATGSPREGVIASLQATKVELAVLQPGYLDAKACFRHLAGISTPNPQNAAPIRPIFVMNRSDNRIVADRDVLSGLEQEANLATMPWEDFEHLVRQLFEWMFKSDGVDVKVTRASRDRGVDAIMFDPDPVRGGKYVLQAKRYTRTVDVAAVRDLYGTVVNEGANRGILVTTASYGPDAYEFAKNKPISLIDGPNLIALLTKHGRRYRIDLDEARRIEDVAVN